MILKNATLDIELGFSINLSDVNYYNKTIYDNWDATEFRDWAYTSFPRLAFEHQIYRKIRENGLEQAKDYVYDLIDSHDPEYFSPLYKISSVDFYLPIYYSIGDFMFTFSTFLNVPISENKFTGSSSNLLFVSSGVSYIFSFSHR